MMGSRGVHSTVLCVFVYGQHFSQEFCFVFIYFILFYLFIYIFILIFLDEPWGVQDLSSPTRD